MGVYIVRQKQNASVVYLVEASNQEKALNKLSRYSRMPSITPQKLSSSDELTAEIDILTESEEDIEQIII
jgi:hypothetical protein